MYINKGFMGKTLLNDSLFGYVVAKTKSDLLKT